jgi:hypothetical protein
MTVERIPAIAPPPEATVKVKLCGNVAEIKYTQNANNTARIRKINKEEYILLSTGEIKKFEHHESRLDDKQSLKNSLTRLKDYINTNCTNLSKCRWLTLTYKEVMQDTDKLYRDFKDFNRKCRKRFGQYEFIVACEYQKRGSLHLHCILIFKADKAPFMKNDIVAELWNNRGFVNIRKISSVTDLGRYIAGYIGDASAEELNGIPAGVRPNQLKVVEVEENGKKTSKAIAKGARLAMLPPHFRLYRISKGIRKPTVKCMSNAHAESMLTEWAQTFQTTYRLTDESRGFNSIVNTCYYNKILGQQERALLEKARLEQEVLQK